ncbi:MAG: hypothetical protein ABEK12_00640 [Candidatus Nanohaloarchaea archaeon]
MTTSVRGGQLKIRDIRGNVIREIPIGSRVLKPGETEIIEASWYGSGVEQGQYQVSGNVNYLSDRATITGRMFSLPGGIQVVPPNATGDEPRQPGKEPLPIWLVAMVLALLGVLMYSFEIEPVWIAGTIGFLAIAAGIVLTGIPDYTLAILIIVLGGVYYVA